uniref:Uncharacterized protein n=1 Tax=Nelumbo nucifera TaxID=4432 RepID=A0A822ZN03_NELNU|nr:TPA_asm: hypothetical protein HUJ06_004507 [Nelumbo nucifera]
MLNLANNNFSGLIPSSLTNDRNLTLDYSGNTGLCAPNQSSCANSVNGTSNLPHPTNSQSNISTNLANHTWNFHLFVQFLKPTSDMLSTL